VAAGDGTLNEAADGLIGTDTALAPLPGGSTNVFARTIGVPNSIMAATEQLVESLAAGSTKRVGVGEANGRHFLFHLGCGYDAEVIEQVERRPWVKRRLAHSVFAVAAVTTFFRGLDRERPAFRITDEHGDTVDDGFYAIVSNTKPYAFFGPRPLLVTKDAGLDRALALTMFTRLEAGSTLAAAGSAMLRGKRLAKNDAVLQRADLTALTVVALHGPFPWQVDGDYLGEVERLEIRYVQDALVLVMPTSRR
jgi:diacylglycerol kinase family enzyme